MIAALDTQLAASLCLDSQDEAECEPEAEPEQEFVETLTAPSDRPLEVWLQPWGQGLKIPAGCKLELRASSPANGRLKIHRQSDCLIVDGWTGCTIRMFYNGEFLGELFNYYSMGLLEWTRSSLPE